MITLKYDDASVADESNMAVLHYNSVTTKYEPVTVLAHDTVANTFNVEARTFSPFILVSFAASVLPSSHSVTGFSPGSNGWNINNFGSYFAPGGNCLGMSGYAAWFFGNRSDSLNGKFSSAGSPTSIAQLVVSRAHLAQSQYWAGKSLTYLSTLGDAETALLMKLYLALFDQPLILLLTASSGGHAAVVYGYDATGFTFYDVNVTNASQTVTFNGSSWGTYGAYNKFSFVAIPSLGRTEDFAALTTEAEGGFASSSLIALTSPTEGQQIPSHTTTLSGSLSASLSSAATLVAYVKGIPQSIPRNNGGEFSASLPVASVKIPSSYSPAWTSVSSRTGTGMPQLLSGASRGLAQLPSSLRLSLGAKMIPT